MTCVFLKKGDCSGYDMRLEWKSLLESTHSSNFSLRLNRENSKSWNSSILSMLRGSILQHSKLECPARLASCLCTLCFWTKLNFNRGGDPPSGGREGEKGKGGRAEGTCPRGALARSASPPLPPPPPWVPGTRPEIPLFVFFLLFLSTFSAQPVISCAIVVRALSTFSFTLQRVASPTARIFKMLHSLR